MPEFVPGLELAGHYYREAVRPVLDRRFPGLAHSAALIGSGSEVLGFDTPMSRDHNWGPRVDLFVSDDDHPRVADALRAALSDGVPRRFRGYATRFVRPPGEPRTLLAAADGRGAPYIEVLTPSSLLRDQLAIALEDLADPRVWLTLPEQRLRGLTAGRVYHDGLGALGELRRSLAYYPDDVWRYLLAAGWQLIGQEEPFMGRTADAGDALGSRVITARLVRWSMRLAFLMERTYAPYAKWLGTAFGRLPCAEALGPHLTAALDAPGWRDRERHLSRAYEALAGMHNALALTDPLPERVSPFHDRPFRVIHGQRFADAITATIQDARMRALPQGVGGVDQLADNTDALTDPRRCRALAEVYNAR